MEEMKQEKQNLRDVVAWYIVVKNNFKKDIESLKIQIKGIEEKSTTHEELNNSQYHSYEKQIQNF